MAWLILWLRYSYWNHLCSLVIMIIYNAPIASVTKFIMFTACAYLLHCYVLHACKCFHIFQGESSFYWILFISEDNVFWVHDIRSSCCVTAKNEWLFNKRISRCGFVTDSHIEWDSIVTKSSPISLSVLKVEDMKETLLSQYLIPNLQLLDIIP